ncbi:MAG: hypothetical protein KTR31_31940 [Myxococcales bacterium]|nr:hypothetical protein [Myxococcales bacterium]
MPRLLAVLILVLVTSLACSDWLVPRADLIGVERRDAVSSGYTVPVHATDVHVRDRATMDVRSTWFRYALPDEPINELRNELTADANVQTLESWGKPDDWPDFAPLGFETPSWFVPEGEVYLRELDARDDVVSVTSGRMWALSEEGVVHVWMWSWEGWRFVPDGPVLGQP